MGLIGAHAMRHRLTLQQQTTVTDAGGGRTVTWSTYGKVSGKLTPRPIRTEALASGQIRANEFADAIIDSQELTATGAMRVVDEDSRTWRIIGVSQFENVQRLQLELHKP